MLKAIAITGMVLGAAGAPAVFTPAQARHGTKTYAAKCAPCHGAHMEGDEDAPPLAGPSFRQKWLRQPISELFAKIRVTMPQDEPGSLKPEEAADLVAAALAMNRLPSGRTALPADPAALQRIRAE